MCAAKLLEGVNHSPIKIRNIPTPIIAPATLTTSTRGQGRYSSTNPTTAPRAKNHTPKLPKRFIHTPSTNHIIIINKCQLLLEK